MHSDSDVRNDRIGIYQKIVLLTQFHYFFPGIRHLDDPTLCGLHAKNDILQYRKIMHQFKMLVNHTDPKRVGIQRPPDLHFFSLYLDYALFRLIQAKKHTHQSGFSCTVLSQQCMDLALL